MNKDKVKVKVTNLTKKFGDLLVLDDLERVLVRDVYQREPMR